MANGAFLGATFFLLLQALSEYYATMIAAIVKWCSSCHQIAAAWCIYMITTVIRWYTHSLEFAGAWYASTIATLISYYTYCSPLVFDAYHKLKGHTTVTDYYASYYKRPFLQQCTEAKASVHHKTLCSFGGQWPSHFMLNMAVWVAIPIALLAVTNKCMSSRIRRFTRALYAIILVLHLALMPWIEDIAVMFLGALLVTLLVLLIIWNSAAISASLDSLLGRLDRYLDRLFFQRLDHARFCFKRMLTQVFLPLLTAVIWAVVLAVWNPLYDYWLYLSEPVNPDFDLREDLPFTGLGPPRADGPLSTVADTQPADDTSGNQPVPEFPLTDGVDTGPVGISYGLFYDSESESSSSEDGNRHSGRNKADKKEIIKRVKKSATSAEDPPTMFYKAAKKPDPRAIYDAEERRKERERDEKSLRIKEASSAKIAKGKERSDRIRLIASNDLEIETLTIGNDGVRKSNTSTPTVKTPPKPSSGTKLVEEGESTTKNKAQAGPLIQLPAPIPQVPIRHQPPPSSTQPQPDPVVQTPAPLPQVPVHHQPPPSSTQQPTNTYSIPAPFATLPPPFISATRAPGPLPGPTTFNQPNLLISSEFAPHVRTARPEKGADSMEAYRSRILGGGSLLTAMRREQERATARGSGGDGKDDGKDRKKPGEDNPEVGDEKEDEEMSDAGSDDSDGLTGAINDVLDRQSGESNSVPHDGSAGAAPPNQKRVASKEDEMMKDALDDTVTPGFVNIAADDGANEMESVTKTEANINSALPNPASQQNQSSATSHGSRQAQPQNHNNAGSAPHRSSTQRGLSRTFAAPDSSNTTSPLFRGLNLPAFPPAPVAPQTGFLSQDHTMVFGSVPAPQTITATVATSAPFEDTVLQRSGSVSGPAPAPAPKLQTPPVESEPAQSAADLEVIQRRIDKQLGDLIEHTPNTSGSAASYGGVNNHTSAPTNLTGQPRGIRDAPTTRHTAQPANFDSKQVQPAQTLVDYPSSKDEGEPDGGSTHESEDLSLNSEEKEAGPTTEEIEWNEREKKKLTEKLAQEERDKREEEEAEKRLASQPPPRISSSDSSILSDDPHQPSVAEEERERERIEREIKEREEAERIGNLKKTRKFAVPKGRLTPTPTTDIFAESQSRKDEWDGERYVEQTAAQKAAAAGRKIHTPVGKLSKAPTRPGGCPMPRSTTANAPLPPNTYGPSQSNQEIQAPDSAPLLRSQVSNSDSRL